MRTSFEKNLSVFNEVEKKRLELRKNRQSLDSIKYRTELAGLEKIAAFNIEQAAKRRETATDTQKEIARLQLDKRYLMDLLHQRLQAVDKNQAYVLPAEALPVVCVDGSFFVVQGDNKKMISLGDLMTASSWGIQFNLDPETISRSLRKRYVVADIRQRMLDLMNKQILIDELGSAKTNEFKRRAYEGIKSDAENKIERPGIVAERMVKNLLKKITFNNEVDFEITDASVYQDVEWKVDFIVRRKRHYRGVGVKAENSPSIGVQFTTDIRPKTILHKQEQIKRAQRLKDVALETGNENDEKFDYMLISIPSQEFMEAYKKWQADKQPTGPENNLPSNLKVDIMRRLLSGMIEQSVIEDLIKTEAQAVA